MPFEYVPIWRCWTSIRSTASSAFVAAAAGSGSRWSCALNSANCQPVRYAVDRLAFGHEAHLAVDGRIEPGRLADRSVTSPCDGRSSPAIMWSSVDLPAPLGPSRPVTPGPSANETSLTATTLPYQRETSLSSMAGAQLGVAAADGLIAAAVAVAVMLRSSGSDERGSRAGPRRPRRRPEVEAASEIRLDDLPRTRVSSRTGTR